MYYNFPHLEYNILTVHKNWSCCRKRALLVILWMSMWENSITTLLFQNISVAHFPFEHHVTCLSIAPCTVTKIAWNKFSMNIIFLHCIFFCRNIEVLRIGVAIFVHWVIYIYIYIYISLIERKIQIYFWKQKSITWFI